MAVKLTKLQYEVLKTVAEVNGNTEIKEYLASRNGDNYLGNLFAITVTDKTKKLEVIIKAAPQNDQIRNTLSLRNFYLKEIYMYEKVLAIFSKFQDELDVKRPFESYAKFYAKCETERNECLILENLVKNGYSLWNRKIPMDFEHIAIVMSEFGKYHAVSFAMKEKNPELFNDLSECLKQPPTDVEEKNAIFFLKNTSETIQKAIQGNEILEEAHKKIMSTASTFFFEELYNYNQKMVINHGDLWCNNIMFKYEDHNNPKKPTKVCIIDWQRTQYSLPVLDLANFFYTSSSKEVLDEYTKYLKIYYENFSRNLKDMSCDPDELFSFKELETMWKKCAKFSLIMSTFLFKLLLTDNEDAANTHYDANSIENLHEVYDRISNIDKQNERIIDLINFMIDNNFI